MAEATHVRRWRNFVLDGRLQLRYALLVTGLSAAIAAGLGVLIYQQSTMASTQVAVGLEAPGMEWLSEATKEAVRAQLGQSDSGLAASMVAIGIALALLMLTALVVVTHRVVGPLHRMARHFDELRDGIRTEPGTLRRGDQFHDVFDTLREASEALQQRSQDDLDAIVAFLNSAGQVDSPALRDAIEELRALHRQKLGPDGDL